MHSVPIGAIGVASKENIPSNASCAKRFGFCVLGCIILRVMSICSRSLHQLERRYDLGTPDRIATKWFFQVRMAHSVMFVRCISGGVYWKLALLSVMKASTS